MNLFLLFMGGLIFLTCFYGQTQAYAANWFLIFGMVFSTAVITWIMTEQ
jgi:1,4-dihydroxy-2-naphthoate octaprenyltransferase